MSNNIIIENINNFIIQLITENMDMVQENNIEELLKTEDTKEKVKEFVKKNFKSKSTKKQKDPKAPKRSKSAWLFFVQEMRPLIKQNNKQLEFGPLSKLVGASWKSLKEDKKRKKEYSRYTDMAEKDKKRFEEEMLNYEPSEGFKKKKTKKENKIKGKRNAYIFFCSEKRQEVKKANPGMSFKDRNQKLSVLWKEIKLEDTEEYKRFVQMAEKDKKRYHEETSSESEDKSDVEESDEKSDVEENGDKSDVEESSSESDDKSDVEKSGSEESDEKDKKKKKKKNKKGWKGKGAAFKNFRETQEENNPKMKVKDIKKKWVVMTDEEQKKYKC